MRKKHQSKWNVKDLSDADIFDAIRYLDPDLVCLKQQKEDTVFVICVTVVILVLGCVGFAWLIWR